MPENKNQLVIGFLVLGLALVGLSTYFSFFAPRKTYQEIPLAKVQRETGKVYAVRAGYTQKELVETRTTLVSLDSVETQDIGEALILFENSYQIRVFNNAMVTLEKVEDQQDFHVVLIIKRGDIKVESFGRDGDLFIAKNGERISAAQYNSSQLAHAAVVPPVPVDNFSNPAPANEGLAEDEISTTMNEHRSSFFKCYTQLLQKDPTAKGQVSLSFTVENNGKLSVAEVTASDIKQDEFRQCLVEVLRRIEFRSFRGPPISTLFPLKFE
ncbi:MAG: energy transducer TonB [Bdellovibrio sp. CG10_big_fil_rev_8_21_14_0_10_47_8]|nr:MAG: energy transducer TonB [Bdellovibrio sp. CG10_big_fil_rev_8_21_14_0_10_47_8]